MAEQKELTAPCPYMIFDPNGYHTCELKPCDGSYCVCAWFYDLSNPGFTIEISRNPKTDKIGSVSTFDLPDSEEYKDMVRNTLTEDDVPKLCPRGLSFKQIDAKIKILHERVNWGNRPMDRR